MALHAPAGARLPPGATPWRAVSSRCSRRPGNDMERIRPVPTNTPPKQPFAPASLRARLTLTLGAGGFMFAVVLAWLTSLALDVRGTPSAGSSLATIALAGAVSAALFAGLAWIATGRLLRPIAQMAAAAERVRAGHSGRFDAPMPGRQDEVAALNASLIDLVETLESKRRELMREVGERRHAEEALAASERRFRGALEEAPFPIMVHADDGEVLALNRAWTDLTGYTPEDIPTVARWMERAYGGEAAAVSERVARLYDLTGRFDEGDLVVRCADGDHRTWAFSSAPLEPLRDGRRSVISIAADVTASRATERALRDSEASHRLLFESNPHPMWVYDTQTLRFLAVNDAAVARYGYGRDEFMAMTLEDIRPPEDIPHLLASVRDDHAGLRRDIRARHRLADGALIDVEISTHGLHFVGRQARLTLALDVTEKVAAEGRIRQAYAELEERVASRTAELVAANRNLEAYSLTVSHDLRSPLRAIGSFAGLLAERYRDRLDEPGRRYLDNIILASERMNRLIDDLLAFGRLGRDRVDAVSVALGPLLATLVEEQSQRIEALGATVTLAADLPSVLGDPTLLRQIFGNLLDNALTYRRPDVPVRVGFGWEPRGDMAVVSVTDNGIGIAAEHHERVFQVFERLHSDEAYPGTGIGLATAQKAALLLRGRVLLESGLGEGATFRVELPTRGSRTDLSAFREP